MTILKTSNTVKALIMLLAFSCIILIASCSTYEERVNQVTQELKDKDPKVRLNAAKELGEIKDPRAVEPLIAALKEKNLKVVAGASFFFIRMGIYGSEPVLIEALNKHGDKMMAEDFLNCGNSQLEEAARIWAAWHGYSIISGPGGGGPRWGSS